MSISNNIGLDHIQRISKEELDLKKSLKKIDGNKKINNYVDNFTVYTNVNLIKKFLFRNYIYKKTLKIPGSIFECGMGMGSGFFAWVNLKNIYEPYNHTKKIIGFDTFAGFPNIHRLDKSNLKNNNLKKRGVNYNNYNFLKKMLLQKEATLPLSHIKSNLLIKGNISFTIRDYLKKNKNTLISVLYLDLDLYKPTLDCLKYAYDCIPKGGVIVFDELNHDFWPGETLALKKFFNIKSINLIKNSLSGTAAYLVV
jgi:hypothetical protein